MTFKNYSSTKKSMPFTFSHPAIVLPLTCLPKRWYSLTGLIIGSLVPDFEYFLRMKVQSNYSHTISGLFWFDLPFGLLLTLIFHNVVRNCLIHNLPIALKSRFYQFIRFNWNKDFKKNWFIVLISLLIGSASHLFWDSFTHETGFFVRTIPALIHKIKIAGKEIPLFKILQHSSSLIGVSVLGFAIFKMRSKNDNINQINLEYWIISLSITFTIIGIKLITGLNYKSYGNLIVTIVSAGLIALIITPLLLNNKNNCLR